MTRAQSHFTEEKMDLAEVRELSWWPRVNQQQSWSKSHTELSDFGISPGAQGGACPPVSGPVSVTPRPVAGSKGLRSIVKLHDSVETVGADGLVHHLSHVALEQTLTRQPAAGSRNLDCPSQCFSHCGSVVKQAVTG